MSRANGRPTKRDVLYDLFRSAGTGATYEQGRKAVRAAGHDDVHPVTFQTYKREFREAEPGHAQSEVKPLNDWPYHRTPADGPEETTMTHEATNGQAGLNGRPPAPAPRPVPARLLEDDRRPPHEALDHLAKLARFACAVEAVGGIETAQRLLDVLKQMRGALR